MLSPVLPLLSPGASAEEPARAARTSRHPAPSLQARDLHLSEDVDEHPAATAMPRARAGRDAQGDVLMVTEILAQAVRPGWVRCDNIAGLNTADILEYPDGEVRFRHHCDRGERGLIVCAPALQLGNGHTLIRDKTGAPTVTPSILCADCATHGFVTNGVWRNC